MAAKLKRKPDGSFTARPKIVTDGLKAYQEAISTVFGGEAALHRRRGELLLHS